ncbi:hypothetical protein HYI36_05275 [Bacillus sp. Gen3]|nr:hypothetical protein [Bacillus sp. Gen3]
MTDFHNILQTQEQEMLEGINTCAICRIETVDLSTMKADVVPLFDEELTPILNVPIAAHQTSDFIIRVPYKVGDLVLVVFSQRDIDPIMFGGGEASVRMHGIDDALIVGGINLFNDPLPNEHSEDIVISKKDMTTKIVLTKDDEIIFKSKKITIDAPDGVEIKGGDITMTGGAITANGEDLTVDLV